MKQGMVHTQAGYLLMAAMTHKYVFDVREGDIFACVADVGWITGSTYAVYAPVKMIKERALFCLSLSLSLSLHLSLSLLSVVVL